MNRVDKYLSQPCELNSGAHSMGSVTKPTVPKIATQLPSIDVFSQKVKLQWLFVLGILFTHFVLQAGELRVSDGELQSIGKSLVILEDQADELSANEALAALAEFEPNSMDVFTHSANNSRFWFYFEAANHSGQDIFLNAFNSNLTSFNFYKIDAEGNVVDSTITGCLLPDSTRQIDSYTFGVLLAERQDTASYQYLFSIKTGLPFEAPIYIGSITEIKDHSAYYNYMSLFFLGGVIIMFLYNGFVFFITRSKLYLNYLLYLLPSLFLGAYISNFPIAEYLLGKTLTHAYPAAWFWPLFFFTARFISTYFNLKEKNLLMHRILQYESYVFIAFGVVNLFVETSVITNIYQLFVGVFYVTCLTIGFIFLYYGSRRAALFCLGWSPLALSIGTHLIVYNGWLPYSPILRSAAYIGVLSEILIFAIALGKIITRLQYEQSLLNATLQKKNEELEALNLSLDSFNYHVSHDLKTVLNNSKGLANMILKYGNSGDVSKVAEISQKLNKVIDNGVDTVQSFLSLGTVDSIFKTEQVENIEVRKQIQETLEINDLASKIDVVVNDSQINYLPIHKKAFESIFLNFLTNSIKYNENPPKAEITFTDRGKFYEIKYCDNGIGIDLEKHSGDIFEPFKRFNVNRSIEGTGVGLYLIKRIVLSYGGEIKVKSKLQQGTQFIFTIQKKK